MFSQTLLIRSRSPVTEGNSFTFSSHGKQTPGRMRGWGQPVRPFICARLVIEDGRSHGGVATGVLYVPAE